MMSTGLALTCDLDCCLTKVYLERREFRPDGWGVALRLLKAVEFPLLLEARGFFIILGVREFDRFLFDSGKLG